MLPRNYSLPILLLLLSSFLLMLGGGCLIEIRRVNVSKGKSLRNGLASYCHPTSDLEASIHTQKTLYECSRIGDLTLRVDHWPFYLTFRIRYEFAVKPTNSYCLWAVSTSPTYSLQIRDYCLGL